MILTIWTSINKMEVYTDGCSNKNGSGWAVVCPERKIIVRGDLPGVTNQQAELSAVIQAVYFFGIGIKILTDSKYVIGCFTEWYQRWLKNGWINAKNKPIKNQKLIKLGLDLGANLIKYTHVYGHSENTYNDMADYYSKNSQLRSEHIGWILII